MAKLTGVQIRRFRDILLDAFTTLDAFDAFMTERVERNRAAITTADGLELIIFKVIERAEAEPCWTESLLLAAIAERPNLAPLQEVVAELLVQVRAPDPPLPPPNQVDTAEVAGQLARLFKAGLAELGKDSLARAELSLQDNIQRVRRMAVYKDAHDGLQEVEADFNTLAQDPDLYPDGKLATPDRVRWSSIRRRCLTMLNALEALVDETAASFLKEEDTYLLEALQQASADLNAAVDAESPGDLDGVMLDLYEIIRKYSPRMNTNIVAEVKNLSLLELADALRTVYDALAQGAQLDGFGAALDAFEGTADRLAILRDEHDRWQLIEDDLRREADQLPTRGVDPFRRRWERTLGLRLCQQADAARAERWAARLSADIAMLEAALVKADSSGVADALLNCRLSVTSRFRQVDDELKRVCDGLRDASVIMERELNIRV